MRHYHHVSGGLSNRYRCGHLWRGVAAFFVLILCADALAGRWSPPRSPTMRGTSTTIQATQVGKGVYDGTPSFNSGGWVAGVVYPSSVRGVPAYFEATASGSVSQVATALGAAARGAGPAAFVGLMAAWIADNPWEWDQSELAWLERRLDPPGTQTYYRVTHPCNGTECTIRDSSYESLANRACPLVKDNTCENNKAHSISSGGAWCGNGTRKDNGEPCGSNRVYLNFASSNCPAGQAWDVPGHQCKPQTIALVPLSPVDMDQTIEDGINFDPGLGPDAWASVDQSDGPDIIPDTTPADPPYSGPPSVSGDSSTSSSSGPDGTTTTTTQTNHNFDYETPGQIGIEDQTTTTTTDPSNNVTTTTTTDGGDATTDGTGTGTGGSPAVPPIDVCAEHPEASGCAPLDTIEDAELPTQDFPVDMSIDSVPGSCPAPIVLDVLGTSHELSWQPVCDFAESLSPLVRALGAFSAGAWLFFMLRK